MKMFLEIGRLRGSINTSSASGNDNNTQWQYLRLPAAEESSLEVVASLCVLANDSQSFYQSESSKQWVRTVVSLDGRSIHSNVIPRDAYMDPGDCLDPHRCRGFSPMGEIGLNQNRSCRSCALAQQMQDEVRANLQMVDADQMIQNKALLQIEDQVHDEQDLALSVVHKIVWRSGTFVRKRFDRRRIFERELEVATAVSHPNLVHCFGWSWLESDGSGSESGGERWSFELFMECLEVDLQRFLSEEAVGVGKPLVFHDALNVLLQVAEAMKHLHESGLLHGDLKPQNIFLSRVELAHTGVQCYLVKVGDFGCAQRVNSPDVTFCADIGTLNYTAPEVFRQRRNRKAPPPLDPKKIDVFSFGVVAYQVLTGAVSLYVDYRPRDVANAVMEGIRPDSKDQGANLDGRSLSMLTLVKRCWAENPEERPSFSQICDELNTCSKEDGLCGNLENPEERPSFPQICDELNKCSKELGLPGNLAKHKHFESIGEDTTFLKLAKPACEQALESVLL